MRIAHILICPSPLRFAQGWSLLCHQNHPTIMSLLRCQSGVRPWVGVTNGSEVTICGAWYDSGCRSPSQVNSLLTESWGAEYGRTSDRPCSRNSTRQASSRAEITIKSSCCKSVSTITQNMLCVFKKTLLVAFWHKYCSKNKSRCTKCTFDDELSEVWDTRAPGRLSDTAVKVLIRSLDAV